MVKDRTETMEFPTVLLRSVDSSDVLYSRIFVCVAFGPLSGKQDILGYNFGNCVAVLRDDLHVDCSKRTGIQIVSF